MTPRARPAALAMLVAGIAAIPAAPAAGQDAGAGDYDPGSAAWNGLETFTELARGIGLPVEIRTSLAWNELGPGDALVILYPAHALDPGHVTSFLQNGGRLLIGDDFGEASIALGQLGLVRSAAVGVVARRYHDGDQDLPVARALDADHPLAAGVPQLTTNHPALFTETDGSSAVFGFGPGEVVVAAGPYGAGRFVALADPSVLINRMLELEDNLAFARNALDYLVDRAAGGRVVILGGDFRLSGEPTRPLSNDRGVAGFLTGFNGWLDELNLYSLAPLAMRLATILLAIVAALGLWRLLSAPRPGGLSGGWTRVAAPDAPPGAAALVAAVDDPAQRQSYLYPAAVLRDSINRRLGALLAVDDPLSSLSEQDLRRAVAQHAGGEAAAAALALRPLVRSLPTRAQAASPWAFPAVGRREFDRLGAAADRLYRSLGAESPV